MDAHPPKRKTISHRSQIGKIKKNFGKNKYFLEALGILKDKEKGITKQPTLKINEDIWRRARVFLGMSTPGESETPPSNESVNQQDMIIDDMSEVTEETDVIVVEDDTDNSLVEEDETVDLGPFDPKVTVDDLWRTKFPVAKGRSRITIINNCFGNQALVKSIFEIIGKSYIRSVAFQMPHEVCKRLYYIEYAGTNPTIDAMLATQSWFALFSLTTFRSNTSFIFSNITLGELYQLVMASMHRKNTDLLEFVIADWRRELIDWRITEAYVDLKTRKEIDEFLDDDDARKEFEKTMEQSGYGREEREKYESDKKNEERSKKEEEMKKQLMRDGELKYGRKRGGRRRKKKE